LNQIVARHEALRTVFALVDGKPLQRIAGERDSQFHLIEHDLRECDGAAAELERLVAEEAGTSMDLHAGPLIRGRLIRQRNEEYVLLITIHHIVSDAWSFGVFSKELSALYRADVGGEEDGLPELAIQYADYAVWQRKWLEGEVLGKQAEYWKRVLAGAPEVLQLPTDHVRPEQQSYSGAAARLVLDEELTAGLRGLSRKHRITLYVTLLAGWATLLARLSGQDDVVVGTPAANRNRVEIEGLIGFFVNTLALRLSVSDSFDVGTLLAHVKSQAVAAQGHQGFPFEQVVEIVRSPRSLAHNPVFQVMFTWLNTPKGMIDLAGLQVSPFTALPHDISKFDLMLTLQEKSNQIVGVVEYATALYEQSTIERYIGYFRTLLGAMVADDRQRVDRLPMLPQEERQQLLYEWNATEVEYPRDKCVHELFEEQAERTPNTIAIVYQEQALTYGELNRRANRLAHYLRELGVRPDERVAICAERGLEMVVGLLAILKSGGAYVPLEPSYPEERLRAMVEDSGAQVVLVQGRWGGSLAGVSESVRVVVLEEEAQWSGRPATNPKREEIGVSERNVAYVIYTSGSTGLPKGVMNHHQGVVNRLQWMQEAYQLNAADAVLQKTPYSFDVSVWEFFWPLLAGARLVMAKPEGHKDAEYLRAIVAEERITNMHFVPSMLQVFLEEGWGRGKEEGGKEEIGLKRVICSGEALGRGVVRRFQELLPGTELHNLYGPTEAAVEVTAWRCVELEEGRSVPIGRPIANTRIYILEGSGGLSPIGVWGEIHIAGIQVAWGYLGRAELTAERFVPDPFSGVAGARMYRTGDLGRWQADGTIEFLGRNDFQVKVRGFRIELGEIEARLMEHAGVQEAVVLAREDTPGDKRLVTYFVADKSYRGFVQNGSQALKQISEWTIMFDEAYRRYDSVEDATFNISGWNSSYTGQPIPPEEMRLWVETTVQRILSLRPKRVLEIGCGTGLLLFRIAPECAYYHGTDVSQTALDFLDQQMRRLELNMPQVVLECKAAHEFGRIEEQEKYDVVVLNSVVQYFPDVQYLLEVLTGAVRALRRGGAVFIGDVRSFPLLESFHASVLLSQSPDSLSCEDLWERVETNSRQEGELVIDPEFFTALQQRLPQINWIEINLKRGRSQNELNRFRYDVVLHVGEPDVQLECSWLDWNAQLLSLDAIQEILARTQPDVLGIACVPNCRVLRDVAAVRILTSNHCPATVGELRRELDIEQQFTIDLEDLWVLAQNLQYAIEVRWCQSTTHSCDVLFRRKSSDGNGVSAKGFVGFLGETNILRPLETYANDPLWQRVARGLVPELRCWLTEKLPEYMIPAAYVQLESMPLTPNGKLDRKALPAPKGNAYGMGEYEVPLGEMEIAVAGIWEELLDVERVGRRDNFFELGGHSLLAVRAIARVREALKVEVAVRDLFAHPVLTDLARALESAASTELSPIVVVERGPRLPLSFAQQRLWFLAQMEGVSEVYHIPIGLQLKGGLDRAALRKALDRIVARHEALRTIFALVEGEPVQRIMAIEDSRFHLVEHDLRGRNDSREELARLAAEEAEASFDLEAGPLIRGRLIRLGEEEDALLITMHHVVSDGWSMGVFSKELSRLYRAFVRGEGDPLPELEIQYADYAVWQRKWIEGEILQQQAAYWKKALAEAPALLELPADHPRPAQQDYTGGAVGVVLDEALTAGVRQLCRRHGATLYMTLLAGWTVLLARLSGQPDVVTGTPVANRNRTGIENLIGLFVNTLVLRMDVSGSLTGGELLERVKAQAIEVQQYQDIPFEHVVEIVRPVRSLAYSPLFQTMFAWQNATSEKLRLGGLEATPLKAGPHVAAKFDLTLSLRENGDRIVGGLEYATALFERTTVERWLGYFRMLLEGMVADEGQMVNRLPMLTEAERWRVLYEWNETVAEYAEDKCIHELFEEQVERRPGAVAVVYEDEQLSYGELNRRANRLAHYLRGLGVKPDTLVAVCVERSLEMIVGLLAVMKAGGAYVPLDPAYPGDRLRYMVEDSAPKVLLTQGHLREQIRGVKRELVVIDLSDPGVGWQEWPETNPEKAGVGLTAEHLAYVIYTSGSTGTPKGVMVAHRGVMNFLWSMRREPGIETDDVLLATTRFSFDIAALELYLPLTIGAQLRILGGEVNLDAVRVSKEIEHDVTMMQATPASWRMLLDAGLEGTGRLKVLCGGEALNIDLARTLASRSHSAWNLYGPTETTIWSSVEKLKKDLSGVSIGRPIANTQIYIFDSHGEPVPIGVAGEIHIGGTGIARGYLNRPELTGDRFVPDPFSNPGGPMYRTGDLGRWRSDGNIEFLGRNDFQVKIRGFRIELGEIEARLKEHEGVREAVVLAREDTPGDKRLVAYYTAREQNNVGAQELRTHVATKLPEYMVPAAYVKLESLPLTPNGKLDRKALPAPEGNAYGVRQYEEPQGAIEELLADIWAQLLKMERVGRHDNFFDLGGHSLLAVRAIARVQEALKVEVAIRDLFARPVLQNFASALAIAAPAELPAIPRAPRGERIPLSLAQQRLWFLAQMEGVSQAYHIQIGWCLKGEMNRAGLRRALDRMVARHEVLRTTFAFVDGEPVQQIAPAEESRFHLTEHDLRHHTDAGEELKRVAAEESGTAFNLQAGPLIRGRLIRLADEENALLITMHHIVSDGWSMGVFTNELSTSYGAFVRGEADPLPELKIQYADYAIWQRKWLEGEVLGKQAEYWKRALAGAPEVLQLPTDHVRPEQQSYSGAAARLVLDEELTAGLRGLSRKHRTTLYMTVLAGWATLLARLSGQDEVVVGTPAANRNRVETEGLIGFFVNTLALRLGASGTVTVGELLERVKGQVLAAQEHEGIPFERVVEIVRPPRSLAHNPVFQVMFTWLNTPKGMIDLAGLQVSPFTAVPHDISKFDLMLVLREEGHQIVGVVEYATALYEQATIERYIGYFRTVLGAMVADDRQSVDRLPMLPQEERQQLLYEWNATEVEYPRDKCVHELFEEQVKQTPNTIAIVYREQTLTYGELNRRANRLAHYLRELGVRPDERVAICAERGLEMVVGLLGVLKAGGAYVPLDPTYPAERLRFMLEDSAPIALLTQTRLGNSLMGSGNGRPTVMLDCEGAEWMTLYGDRNPRFHEIGVTAQNLACIIYTSGSTGTSKGVAVQHGGIVNLVHDWTTRFGNRVRRDALQASLWTSFGFDVSIFELFAGFYLSATVNIVPEQIRGDSRALSAWFAAHGIAFGYLPPFYIRDAQQAEAPMPPLPLELVLVGVEPSVESALYQLQRNTPGLQIVNGYGPAETTVFSTTYPEIGNRLRNTPIGRPLANTRIYILDAYGEPVPVGVTGELYIGGAGVARGYLNRPELTAERFVRDPFTAEAGARMYRTGDLGRRLADRNIEFLGRNDFQVKIRGFRIELGEIEARLSEHEGVRQAVVLAREDTPGEKRLVAYYSAREQSSVGAQELRAHVAAKLPEYMVPAAYVRLESLPLTPSGKLNRKALPAPEGDAYVVRQYEAPQGAIEELLADIWAKLLHLERVGRHDNFFELGGHSLMAVTLVERLAQAGVNADVLALFTTPTLAKLAASFDTNAPALEAPANRIPSPQETTSSSRIVELSL
jgi:amino acid adenylation domain-containing protein